MNKFESLFLQTKWEVERYENAGVDMTEVRKAVEQAEETYKDFVKKTGIIDVCTKKSYTPGGW